MPIAVGMAMGLKRKNSDSKVYVMMGDGEMAEGPTWEAAMSAGSYQLDNIIGIVDVNGIQADGKTIRSPCTRSSRPLTSMSSASTETASLR